MKRLFILLILLPAYAMASVSGVDDIDANISNEEQKKIDTAITTYYQHPSVEKVDTVLDVMNDSRLLRKKISWAPIIGFLTVIFQNNKEHIFAWMARNDYNTYAQDVFLSALLHAKLHEAAMVFAQAHQWKGYKLEQLSAMNDALNLKQLPITVPGHIDTLWGAFFASGDPAYINEILDALPTGTNLPPVGAAGNPMPGSEALAENKKLIQATLWQYAPEHKPVSDAIKARIKTEKDKITRDMLRQFLVKHPAPPPDTAKNKQK